MNAEEILKFDIIQSALIKGSVFHTFIISRIQDQMGLWLLIFKSSIQFLWLLCPDSLNPKSKAFLFVVFAISYNLKWLNKFVAVTFDPNWKIQSAKL